MDEVAKLKQDVRDGLIDAGRLVDLLARTQRQLQATQQQLQAALQRIAELEKQPPSPPTPKVDQAYSLNAEEKRQRQRQKKKRRRPQKNRPGRITTADKIAQAERTEPVFPEGVPHDQCHLSHIRPIWRLENGRAVLIAYAVYRGPRNQYGRIPGTLGCQQRSDMRPKSRAGPGQGAPSRPRIHTGPRSKFLKNSTILLLKMIARKC